MYQRIVERYGPDGVRDVFNNMKGDVLDVEQFSVLLRQLGFDGEGTPALTMEEVAALLQSADRNKNGSIDYGEFLDRMWLASEWRVEGGETSDPNPALTEDEDMGVFARGEWLRGRPGCGGTAAAVATMPGFELGLDRALPMGDMRVAGARLVPKELQTGVWPDNWSLSDHGLVVVDFAARVTSRGGTGGSDDDAADEMPEYEWEPPASLISDDYVGSFNL